MFGLVNYTYDLSSELVMTSPEYYTKVIEKLQTTPNRTIANYLLWRFASNRVRNLPKAIQNIKQKFDKVGGSNLFRRLCVQCLQTFRL